MYTITMLNNKQLVSSYNASIYQGENNADEILFLIPVTYNHINLSKMSTHLHVIDTTNIEDIIPVEFELDLSAETYLQYKFDVTQKVTYQDGQICFWFEFIDAENNVLLKSGDCYVSINATRLSGSAINGGQLTIIQKLQSDVDMMMSMIKEIKITCEELSLKVKELSSSMGTVGDTNEFNNSI